MLKLSPKDFRAVKIELGLAELLNLQLGARTSSLTLDALKASDSQVTILFQLKVMIGEGVGVAIEYAALFDVADDSVESFFVDETVLINTFIQVNAPAIAYPFLRAFVSTLTVNSGYKQVLLPPVNFQLLFDKKRQKSELMLTAINVR